MGDDRGKYTAKLRGDYDEDFDANRLELTEEEYDRLALYFRTSNLGPNGEQISDLIKQAAALCHRDGDVNLELYNRRHPDVSLTIHNFNIRQLLEEIAEDIRDY
jgi:hypothetical protein